MNLIILSKFRAKHAVNKTTIDFFATCRPEAAVAYGCNPSASINLWGRKDPGSVLSRGELLVCLFFQLPDYDIHEDLGSTPCRGELWFLIANFEYLFLHIVCCMYVYCIACCLFTLEYTVLILQIKRKQCLSLPKGHDQRCLFSV